MKEELEGTVLDWLKTLSYKDESITDGFIRGKADKPNDDDKSISIVDYHKPVTQKPTEHRIGSGRKEVIGQGTITLIYKAIDSDGQIIEDAEIKNDQVPDIITSAIFDDPTLNNKIPGEIIVIQQESGIIELKESEDNYPFMTYMIFEYRGLWVYPVIEEG